MLQNGDTDNVAEEHNLAASSLVYRAEATEGVLRFDDCELTAKHSPALVTEIVTGWHKLAMAD